MYIVKLSYIMNGKPLKKNGGKISILDILYFGKYILRYLLFESKRIVFRGSQTSTHIPRREWYSPNPIPRDFVF